MSNPVFCGGPCQSYWWADEHEPIHPTVSAELREPVDSVSLGRAWAETLRAYPLLDCFVDDEDETVVFFRAKGTSRPVRSAMPVELVSEATALRAASVTYWERSVTLSVYHSLVDERGLFEVFKTLLRSYFARLEGTEPDAAYAPIATDLAPEHYFVQNTKLTPRDYEVQPVTLYRESRHIYQDASIVKDGGILITNAELSIAAGPFYALCDKYGASADELFAYVVARGIYAGDLDERRDLCIALMTDFRDTFGVSQSIAPCSKRMPLVVSRYDIVEQEMGSALRAIAATREQQKSDDYIKTHVAMENTYAVLEVRNACLAINFTGELDLGAATEQVTNVSMWGYSLRSAYMIRLGEKLLVNLQYGAAADRYMRAVIETLGDLGVESHVVKEQHAVPTESPTPVAITKGARA